MTKWFHKCDLNWLKARQLCLTATDVKDLLPITKTGRKRVVGDDAYLKVMARKLVKLTDEDCISVGAAARGHILEPYAINCFNENALTGTFYHWDDVVIQRENAHPFELAFSPDAMNEIMNPEIRKSNQRLLKGSNATVIAEIKSYSAEKHMLCGYTPSDELEERWQIATAMAVLDSIETAYLLFYNPSMKNQLYVVDYDRFDLANEITMIKEVEEKWLAWISNLSKLDRHLMINGDDNAEHKIIDEIIKREELNPESEKSVIR